MVQSFTTGAALALLLRFASMKTLKAPLLSYPLRIVPQMIIGGLTVSLYDYMRRRSLQNALMKEQMVQVARTMRKNDSNYGSHIQ